MLQYLRKARVTFPGGFVVNPGNETDEQIKIDFSISKDISSTQNDGSIRIYNLREDHRNAIGRELEDIQLEAGYLPPAGFGGAGFFAFSGGNIGVSGGNVGLIADGQIRDVRHMIEGPDIVTEVAIGEGDTAFRRATSSMSFERGTPVKDIIEQLVQDLEDQGVRRGEIRPPDDLPTRQRPVTIHSPTFREMDRMGRSHNFYWQIQNGAVEVFPSDKALPGAVLIAPDTGMIDVPTITDNGISVSALLNPQIRPGRQIIVQSDVLELNGESSQYRVSAATYTGTNRDGEFKVDIDGEKIEGGMVDEGILM